MFLLINKARLTIDKGDWIEYFQVGIISLTFKGNNKN